VGPNRSLHLSGIVLLGKEKKGISDSSREAQGGPERGPSKGFDFAGKEGKEALRAGGSERKKKEKSLNGTRAAEDRRRERERGGVEGICVAWVLFLRLGWGRAIAGGGKGVNRICVQMRRLRTAI